MKAKAANRRSQGTARARNGYPFLSQGSAAFDAPAWRLIQNSLKLSPRELQIIHGIFDDKLESAIARELGVSVNTIHTETCRLRAKLKSPDRVCLILRITEEFLRLTVSDETTLPSICRNSTNGRCPLARAISPTGPKPASSVPFPPKLPCHPNR